MFCINTKYAKLSYQWFLFCIPIFVKYILFNTKKKSCFKILPLLYMMTWKRPACGNWDIVQTFQSNPPTFGSEWKGTSWLHIHQKQSTTITVIIITALTATITIMSTLGDRENAWSCLLVPVTRQSSLGYSRW